MGRDQGDGSGPLADRSAEAGHRPRERQEAAMNPTDPTILVPVEDYSMGRCPEGLVAPSPPAVQAYDAYGIAALFRPLDEGDADRAGSVDWDLVHSTIQDNFAGLTARVLGECPGIRWKSGRVTA